MLADPGRGGEYATGDPIRGHYYLVNVGRRKGQAAAAPGWASQPARCRAADVIGRPAGRRLATPR
jgi:hypothetical protein